jgi:hypothetical protein
LEPIPPTGHPGRPAHPKRVIDPALIYATVKKTRKGGRIIKVDKQIVFGTQKDVDEFLKKSPSQTINTSYVERSNLDWRLWDAHLTRKSPTAAKSIDWLKAKFAICIAFYNFVRPHESLSRGIDRKFRPTTPAMAANITDHVWTGYHILNYKCYVN